MSVVPASKKTPIFSESAIIIDVDTAGSCIHEVHLYTWLLMQESIIYFYIHTYIRTYIHTYIHAYIHTYIHTCTYIHTYMHTYIHTCTYIHYVYT